jgi:hypothetical protein
MVNWQEAVLPAKSNPEQVTVLMPTGKLDPEDGWQNTVLGPQASVAPAAYVTAAAHDVPLVPTVMGNGQFSTGGVTSRTDTTKPQLVELFAPSVAVQVTVVAPTGKLDPDAGAHTTLTGPCASDADGLNVTGLLHAPTDASTAMLPGQPMVGGSVSGSVPAITTTLKLADTLFWPSDTEQFTGVVPTENIDPEGGEHDTVTRAGQLSV